MTYSSSSQLKKFGIKTEVVLMDFVIKVGRNEVKLPTALLHRQGLDLTAEGVKSGASIKEIFATPWEGPSRTIENHRGEFVELVQPGEIVSLGWARNILTALVQWVQELGEHLDRKEGWMFAASDLPEVMRRVAVVQERRDQLLEILLVCHEAAYGSYSARVAAIENKLEAVLTQEHEIAVAAELSLVNASRADDLALAQLQVQRLEAARAELPSVAEGLLGKFPSRSDLADSFYFSNTTPRQLPSILTSLQGNAEAMNALVEAEAAEQGEAYAAAIRNGISLMGETIKEKVNELSDQFYGHLADALEQLEGLGSTRRFGEKAAAAIGNHVERLGVLHRLLSGFDSLTTETTGLDQQAMVDRLAELQTAFAKDSDSQGRPGAGRDELQARLARLRDDLSGAVLGADLQSLGLGRERLAEWVAATPGASDATQASQPTPASQAADLALML